MKKILSKKTAYRMCSLALTCMMLAGCTGEYPVSEGDETMKEEKAAAGSETSDLSLEEVKTGNYTNGISCHDPQIIAAKDGKYYMTGSHMILAKSEDLDSWEYISNGSAKKYISNLYSGSLDAFKYVGKNDEGGYSVWAGNIFYNEQMDKYLLYFCTSSTYIKSTLALAVSDNPEGPYTYTDTLLYSGFTGSTAEETNIYEVLGEGADISRYLHLGGYDNNKWPNCIDPAVFTDAEGRQWMVYGSWSGGLFLLEIDKTTGLPIHPEADEKAGVDPYFGYHLIGGGHHACEGPYIEYIPETGYYYLFASYGGLTRTGGYQIRQFRSKSPTGPYLDAAGKLWTDEEDYMSYGLKMAGNYKFPSLETAYMAPGGQSVFKGFDGEMYITYHQRFDKGSEYHEPRIHKIFLNEDGWFVMSPFETANETLSLEAYKSEDIDGTFYMLNHGTDVSELMHVADGYSFEDGKINGFPDGTYELSETGPYIHITYDGNEYHGVIVEMNDEAGNRVMCFTACGENNETVWGVRYLR